MISKCLPKSFGFRAVSRGSCSRARFERNKIGSRRVLRTFDRLRWSANVRVSLGLGVTSRSLLFVVHVFWPRLEIGVLLRLLLQSCVGSCIACCDVFVVPLEEANQAVETFSLQSSKGSRGLQSVGRPSAVRPTAPVDSGAVTLTFTAVDVRHASTDSIRLPAAVGMFVSTGKCGEVNTTGP